jgi:hypothetical protein
MDTTATLAAGVQSITADNAWIIVGIIVFAVVAAVWLCGRPDDSTKY